MSTKHPKGMSLSDFGSNNVLIDFIYCAIPEFRLFKRKFKMANCKSQITEDVGGTYVRFD